MKKTCGKCGGPLQAGVTSAIGLVGEVVRDSPHAGLMFVVPGQRTSANPITAFQQGLADEPSDRFYQVKGFRCSNCGALDFYADEEHRT